MVLPKYPNVVLSVVLGVWMAVSLLHETHAASGVRATFSATSTPYKTTWVDNISIISFDGTRLRADAFLPTPTTPDQLFPVVIFPNSWGCPQIEYVCRALQLGERGYVALEYETRGWWESGGLIDTAGPSDLKDASWVIDYVVANKALWHADVDRIAFAGISYGAGITLLTTGTDPRVKVALAMSGWNNLTDFAYGEASPNYKQTQGLLHSAEDVGHPSQDLYTLEADLTTHTNMTFVVDFGYPRSPQRLLDAFNARNIPVFLSSNYGDRFFRPQYMLEFFPLLTGPKMMLLNNGPHAFPEAAGLFINESYIWNQALLWLERHMQNVSNGIDAQKPLQMQTGDSMFVEARMNFTADPSAMSATTWYLGAPNPGASAFGTLERSPVAAATSSAPILYSTEQTLNSGTKDDSWESLGLPFITNLTLANRSTTALFATVPLAAPTIICGTPSVALSLRTNAPGGAFQIYGFMYDVSPDSPTDGTYLTESFFTQWPSGAANTSGVVFTPAFQFHTICRTIAVGHRLAIGFVLYNEQYVPASEDLSLELVFGGANGGSRVMLPIATPQ